MESLVTFGMYWIGLGLEPLSIGCGVGGEDSTLDCSTFTEVSALELSTTLAISDWDWLEEDETTDLELLEVDWFDELCDELEIDIFGLVSPERDLVNMKIPDPKIMIVKTAINALVCVDIFDIIFRDEIWLKRTIF